jgi:hypothetical protein
LYKATAGGLPTLADSGYKGTGSGVFTPVEQATGGQALDADTRTYNMLLRALRRLGERGFALPTQRWRTLQHITTSPSKISDITRAALVLTHFEHGPFARKSVRSPYCRSIINGSVDRKPGRRRGGTRTSLGDSQSRRVL